MNGLPMRFRDKVCIVSGGDSGIGRAVSERFAAEGGRVLLVDQDETHSGEVVRSITGAGGTAAFEKADVAVSAEVRAAMRSRARSASRRIWRRSSPFSRRTKRTSSTAPRSLPTAVGSTSCR